MYCISFFSPVIEANILKVTTYGTAVYILYMLKSFIGLIRFIICDNDGNLGMVDFRHECKTP